MTLKRKLVIVGVTAIILTIIYFFGAFFLKKMVTKEDNKTNNTDTAIDLTGNEYEIKTGKIAESIKSNDYEAVYKEFSWDLKKQFSIENITDTFNSTISLAGKFKNISDIIVVENEDSVTSKIFMKYSKKDICVNLFLDLSGNIDGISLDYCTVPSKTSKYTEKYISVGKYGLHGLLTLPNGVNNPPVVILIQDKGSYDMNNAIYSNKPFMDLAHNLAKKGIAVVRFNKRYSQYLKLSYNEYTIQEEMLDDVNSAIELIYKDKRIDKENIYILGHGLAGALASNIATANKKVKGIISLASSPRHLADLLYDQHICTIGASDLSNNDKLLSINEIESDVNKIKKLKKGGKELILGINRTFWKSLNSIEIKNTTKNLNIPMLFMQGEKDSMTYADVDYIQWEELLKDNKNTTFKMYEDLDHYFIKNNSNTQNTKKRKYINKDVTNDIALWIINNSNTNK